MRNRPPIRHVSHHLPLFLHGREVLPEGEERIPEEDPPRRQAAGTSHLVHTAALDWRPVRSFFLRCLGVPLGFAMREVAAAAAVDSMLPPRTDAAILFVVAAYVMDERNRGLLQRTLVSIDCHHPRNAATLVVDNASPAGHIEASIAAAQGCACDHEPSSGGHRRRVRLSAVSVWREAVSRGQLGTWAAADRYLRGHAQNAELIVLLQHSTALAAPVRLPPGCAAVALSTLVNRTSGGAWMSPSANYMRWASEVAAALKIKCAHPCSHGQLRTATTSSSTSTTSNNNVSSALLVADSTTAAHSTADARRREWVMPWAGAAAHAVLALSRPAWERLRALRAWPTTASAVQVPQRVPPQQVPPQQVPPQQQPSVRELRELWRPDPCARGGRPMVVPCIPGSGLNVGLMNGGLEMLAGILLAHLNRNASRGWRPQRSEGACYVQNGVLKTHGGSFRSEEVYHKLFLLNPKDERYRCGRMDEHAAGPRAGTL